MMDYHSWLQSATHSLIESDSSKLDAEILLESVTGHSRAFIVGFSETRLTTEQLQRLDLLLLRRINGEPIAYLIGKREFWSLPLAVSTATLIPRPDTERLVELALERIPRQPSRILDLGSGSGAIALALAHERPDCDLVGVDIEPEATTLANSNALTLGLTKVNFLTGHWFEPVFGQQFSLIVSNPPYIDAQDPHLLRGDVRFEPLKALVAEKQGLADIYHIIDQAPHYLCFNGWLLLEHGWQQGAAVREQFRQTGFSQIYTKQDYAGNDRVTLGCWSKKHLPIP